MIKKQSTIKSKIIAKQPEGFNLAGLLSENERKWLIGLKKELQK